MRSRRGTRTATSGRGWLVGMGSQGGGGGIVGGWLSGILRAKQVGNGLHGELERGNMEWPCPCD